MTQAVPVPASPPPQGARFLRAIVGRWDRAPSAPFATYAQEHGAQEDGERVVTQGQVRARALRFLAVMRASGAVPGDIVLLILRDGPDSHAAFLGAMLGGLVPSLLPYPTDRQDHALFWRQHQTLFAFCGAALAIVYDELAPDVAACAQGTGIAVIAQSAVEHVAPAALPDRLPAEADVALLQHSSGTTGLKKGVALSYASIARQIEAYAGLLGLAACGDPVVATWLPLYHDMGLVTGFLLPASLGIPIVSLDPFAWIAAPRSLLDAIDRHRATHVWLPNFAFLVLARPIRGAAAWKLDCLRAVVSCSEPCKPQAFDALLARLGPFGLRPDAPQTCYAMAETVFAVTGSAPGAPPRRLSASRHALALHRVAPPDGPDDAVALLSNGRPVEGMELRIEAAGGAQVGEIVLRADFMFSAYHRNPDATQAAFRDGWYATGDLGFLDGGELFVVGRLKDVIIVNGRNILAHDVEAAISAVPGVKPGRCVALGRYSERTGSEQLVAMAERGGDPGGDGALAAAINTAVREACGVPCADVRLVAPDWLVKTTSGKVSRSANADRYLASLTPRSAGAVASPVKT
jgi:acyl-CoA synthetase (AMP-forming)/AMP-acid ligase II